MARPKKVVIAKKPVKTAAKTFSAKQYKTIGKNLKAAHKAAEALQKHLDKLHNTLAYLSNDLS